jgi:tetratricopeptide (TPR) repeat protein
LPHHPRAQKDDVEQEVKKSVSRTWSAWLLMALSGWAMAQPMAGTAVDEARALVGRGEFARAYALLEPRAESFARDREANYLLGVAALDSGHPGVAQMALERALIIDPQFLPARAELGRAYMRLGDPDGARREFDIVRAANPPEEVRRTIDRMVAETEFTGAASASPLKMSGYLSAEAGHDSNINAATNSTVVNLPIFANLPFTLGPLFTAQRSTFVGLGGGIALSAPVSEQLTWFAAGDAKLRENFQQESFKPLTMSALTGLQFAAGQDRYTMGVNVSGYRIGSLELDRRKGLFASWMRDVSARDRLTVFGQYLENTFPQDKAQNTQTYLVGATWQHAYTGAGAPTIGATVFAANEPQRNSDETVGKKYIGGRLSGEYRLGQDLKLVSALSHVYSRYGGISAFFLTKRIEKRYDLDVGVAWSPAKAWTVTPQLIYTRNDSSIAVSDFNRVQVMVTARRDFD